MSGQALIDLMIKLSGLPETLAKREIESLIQQKGYNQDTISLEQFRELLTDLLQDLVLAQQ